MRDQYANQGIFQDFKIGGGTISGGEGRSRKRGRAAPPYTAMATRGNPLPPSSLNKLVDSIQAE